MGVIMNFDQDRRDVIRFDFSGKWTWQELLESIAEAVRLGDANSRNDVIVNLENANYIPSGALGQLRSISRTTPMNGGLYVIVGLNSVTSAVIDVFRRIYTEGRSWRVVRTVDDARTLIEKDRAEKHAPDIGA